MKDQKYNTFRYGDRESNAWLGYFGEIETDLLIASGYYECFEIIFKNQNAKNTTNDSIVYPYIYLARHSIELYLKCFEKIMNSIWRRNNKRFSHDILKLYLHIKDDLFCTSKRFSADEIKLVENIIRDFYEIDKKSQTFRYSHDSEKNKPHFEEQTVCNIKYIYTSVEKLNSIFEKWLFILDQLCYDFGYLKCTDNLISWQIAEIAKLFPGSLSEECKEYAFKNIKIVTDKVILKSEFDEAVKIISSSKRLSSNIGERSELIRLDSSDISRVISDYIEYNQKIKSPTKIKELDDYLSNDLEEIMNRIKVADEIYKNIVQSYYSKEKICDIVTIYHLGVTKGWNEDCYRNKYNEDFKEISRNASFDYLHKVFDKYNFLDKFYIGLEKLGILCVIQLIK